MFGQDGRTGGGWVAGIAALLACVLISAVGVAALRSSTASADTVLERGADAQLELTDGTRRDAVEGERVPRGATVHAGRTGAVLETRDRRVHLGGATSVTVQDGARQELRGGFVIVDAADGPGVELDTSAGTVTAADGSLVRVDGGSLLRVGVLRGDSAAVRAAGRRASADVPTYFQVQVPAGGLPGAPTPFVLTPGDAYERALAADLVRADDDLNALASRLDGDGSAGRVVLASLAEQVPAEPAAASGAAAGTAASDSALGFLIATVADGSRDVAGRYARVRDLRAAGGSWGVVAAIVDAEVGRVGAALSALLDPGAAPVLASESLDLAAVLDLDGDGSAGPAPATGGDDGSAPSAPRPPRESPRPTVGPTSTPGPVDPVTETVDEVVDTVLDLVSPSPSAAPVPPPLTPVGQVVGGVVGTVLPSPTPLPPLLK